MKINDIYKVKIVDYDKDGKGIAFINDKICFIPNVLIDEECNIRITKITKNVLLGELVEILVKSKNRIESDCIYSNRCGGCQLRHITYETELEVKTNKVKNAFKHIAHMDNINYNEIIKADKLYHYRNKAIIPFHKIDNDIIYGMYEKNSHNIVNISNCLIENEILGEILKITKKYLVSNNISIYDENTHKGIFRGIMLRNTCDNIFMLVFIVTKSIDLYPLANLINNKYNMVKSIYLNINDNNNNVMLGYKNKLILGDELIYETILGKKYGVFVNTFLQVNHDQTEKLYSLAIEKLDLTKDDVVLDAFCGMGSITLSMSDKAKEVYGIEVVESAIDNAKENAKINSISNAKFECGKCEDLIGKYVNKYKFSKMVFDPPRKGCDQSFLDAILKTDVEKIVYVSCNVATLARDVKYLSSKYDVVDVTPVDLFPRTEHVEVICFLSLK